MRRSITSEKNAKERIKKEVRYQQHFNDDNLFLGDCKTWERQGVGCHLGKRRKNPSNELREIRLAAGRHRPASAKKLRLKSYNQTGTYEHPIKKMERRRSSAISNNMSVPSKHFPNMSHMHSTMVSSPSKKRKTVRRSLSA